MLSIFKRPVERETLDDWAKISVDVAKVAILAIPVILFGNEPTLAKLINSTLLVLSIYIFLTLGRKLRQLKEIL
ncbi:hypothetical protein [Mannheimia bovis]|uniref:Uncharacterized protein n=1 Tax=Mannheimia bovis TaxID=2770636 RepID=A0A7H1C0G3_9PAST|nr:hypothetical protein [Mannheimia bovis]QNS14468.1 hypothetical protein ICJ55_06775 [Mannheimia bovis]